MAKHADRKTQRQLEDLRKELLDDANTLRCKRHRMDSLGETVAEGRAYREMTEEQKTEKYGSAHAYGYNYQRQRLDNITEEQLTEWEQTMLTLRPELRELAASLDERAEAAWKHIACHDDVTWAKVAEERPKILRDEGTPVLCRLAAVVSSPARVPLGMWVIRNLRQRKKDGHLHGDWISNPVSGLNASAFSAIQKYLEAKPDLQLKEQLDRIGLEHLATQAREYRATEVVRGALGEAGQKMAELDMGELRLMDADDLKHVGKWLQCCIGQEAYGYPSHARNKTKAFLCVFPKDEPLPVCAIEITPVNGSLVLGQVQGRMNRYWEHREKVVDWVTRKETHRELVEALGIEGLDEEVTVTVPRECGYRAAWTENKSPWSDTPVKWDVSQAAIGILTGVANERDAYRFAGDYASEEVAAELKQLVESARERWTNPEASHYMQLEDKISQQRQDVDDARALYQEMDEELRVLIRQRNAGPPAMAADEAEQLLGAAFAAV